MHLNDLQKQGFLYSYSYCHQLIVSFLPKNYFTTVVSLLLKFDLWVLFTTLLWQITVEHSDRIQEVTPIFGNHLTVKFG